MQLLTQETVSYLFHHHGLRNTSLDSLMRKSNLTYNNNVLKERFQVSWRKHKKLSYTQVSLITLTNYTVRKVRNLRRVLMKKEETTSEVVTSVEVQTLVETSEVTWVEI